MDTRHTVWPHIVTTKLLNAKRKFGVSIHGRFILHRIQYHIVIIDISSEKQRLYGVQFHPEVNNKSCLDIRPF